VTGAAFPVLEERDLHLWFCARGVVTGSDEFKRTILSRYAGISPEALRFEQGEHGKPHLVGTAREMQFNLSHSGDWLACAVTGGAPVGVDLELCNPDRVSMRVARRFFREEEFSVLEGCDGRLLTDRFYDFWTLKEAAVKARGEALAPGLSAHGFRLEYPDSGSHENGRISVVPSVAADGAHYFLLDPLSGYRAAVCWMGAAHLPPLVDLYELRVGGDVAQMKVPLRAGTCP
jgi:hypothetical protein